MGIDISKSHFTKKDFQNFEEHLRQETLLLKEYFKKNEFDNPTKKLGLELEVCLVDEDFIPSPANESMLAKINNPMVVPELSRFNLEMNTIPENLTNNVLVNLHNQLKKTWQDMQRWAQSMKTSIMMIGCLPTLRQEMLNLEIMSDRDRYRALNEQIMRLRGEENPHVKICGNEILEIDQTNVMLEAATTSMQIHLQVEFENLIRYFNAALIASAPIVAVCANSPYLFGYDLWEDTRIALFEEAVKLPGFYDKSGAIVRRVTFGSDYVQDSFLELFLENLQCYPVLLPVNYHTKPEKFSHLRLHNGTIWRWNRPILGLNKKGRPHLRIEHRTPSAGPTLRDIIANIAFSVGLIHFMAIQKTPPEQLLPFATARKNFYKAAQFGMNATIHWMQTKPENLQSLLLNTLIPMAKKGLEDLKIDENDIDFYLEHTIRPRVQMGRTGAAWQRAFVDIRGRDFQKLCRRYFHYQESDLPVHEWTV